MNVQRLSFKFWVNIWLRGKMTETPCPRKKNPRMDVYLITLLKYIFTYRDHVYN